MKYGTRRCFHRKSHLRLWASTLLMVIVGWVAWCFCENLKSLKSSMLPIYSSSINVADGDCVVVGRAVVYVVAVGSAVPVY